MTVYTYAQLEGLWLNAGGTTATAPLAAAIAMAESGGDSAATSTQLNGTCTNAGLWQLATPCGGGSGYTVAQLQDPATNAAVAVTVSKSGTDWSTWATYVSGAYKAFESASTTPDTTGLPASATTAATLAAVTASNGATCALTLPVIGCLFQKSALRGLIGGLCLTGAGIIGLVAAVVLAASAFEHSGARTAVNQIRRSVPGMP